MQNNPTPMTHQEEKKNIIVHIGCDKEVQFSGDDWYCPKCGEEGRGDNGRELETI